MSACDAVRSELDWIESMKTRLIGELLPILNFPLGAVAVATFPNGLQSLRLGWALISIV